MIPYASYLSVVDWLIYRLKEELNWTQQELEGQEQQCQVYKSERREHEARIEELETENKRTQDEVSDL